MSLYDEALQLIKQGPISVDSNHWASTYVADKEVAELTALMKNNLPALIECVKALEAVKFYLNSNGLVPTQYMHIFRIAESALAKLENAK